MNRHRTSDPAERAYHVALRLERGRWRDFGPHRDFEGAVTDLKQFTWEFAGKSPDAGATQEDKGNG